MEGMRAIPVAVRERVMKLYEKGKSTTEIAESLGYCEAAIRRVRQHFAERKTLEPRTRLCGRKGLLTPERKEQLQGLVAAQPDATLAELGARMERPFATSAIDLWLRRLGYSYKKNAARRRAEAPRGGRDEGAVARAVRQGGGRLAGLR